MANILKRKGKKGTTYSLHWAENGKRRSRTLGYVDDATATVALKEKEIQLTKGIESVNVPKMKDYLPEYLESVVHTLAHSTYKRKVEIFNSHLIPYFGDMPLDKIRVKQGEAYQKARQQVRAYPNSPGDTRMISVGTINKEMNTIRALLLQAVRHEYLTYNPLMGTKALKSVDSKKTPVFTKEELLTLYQHCAARGHWWMFIANTGLRVGEAKNLKWKHVGKETLMVESTSAQGVSGRVERTKSGKWREVPLSDNAKMALQIFRQEEARRMGFGADYEVDPEGYIFPVNCSERLTRVARTDIRAAGLTGSAHKFRHTFCSELMLAGIQTSIIQKLAGHANIQTTNTYLHLDSETIAKIKINL